MQVLKSRVALLVHATLSAYHVFSEFIAILVLSTSLNLILLTHILNIVSSVIILISTTKRKRRMGPKLWSPCFANAKKLSNPVIWTLPNREDSRWSQRLCLKDRKFSWSIYLEKDKLSKRIRAARTQLIPSRRSVSNTSYSSRCNRS